MTEQPAIREAEIIQEEPYDASDKESVNKQRAKAGRAERERLEFVQAILHLPQGRKWLWQLMESCYVFSSPIAPGDTHGTYENLGRQQVGKSLLADAMQFPAEYVKMANEAKDY